MKEGEGPVAVIDIGSNSARIVVYRLEELHQRMTVPNGFVRRVLAAHKLWVRGTGRDLHALLDATIGAGAHEAPCSAYGATAGITPR